MSTNTSYGYGYDWREDALCRGQDTEKWFPAGAPKSEVRERDTKAAKAVCFACPVRSECLAEALDMRELYGVFGGLDEDERRRLSRRTRVA